MALCLALSSCFAAVTRGIGTVERAVTTGEDFRTWNTQMPAIPAGMGRLVVYPGGSRSLVFDATSVGKGGEQVFVVDRDVCTVLGRSFVYLDLPAGPHEVSADNVSVPFEYRKGRNKLGLDVTPGSLTYVRIDKEDPGLLARSHYHPRLVEATAAHAELNELPLYSGGLQCRPNAAVDRPN